jgi:hypothetical protein
MTVGELQSFEGGTEGGWTDDELTDAELEALALAADAEQPLADDAIPVSLFGDRVSGMLPQWYMAPVMARRVTGWRTPVVIGIVAVLLGLEALGLCSIFGQVVVG